MTKRNQKAEGQSVSLTGLELETILLLEVAGLVGWRRRV